MPQESLPKNEKLEILAAAYGLAPSETLLQQIVEAAGGLVGHYASKYSSPFNRDDLTQAGYEGLLKALQRFDPDREVRFSTYASYYIRGEILKELYRGNVFDKPPWLAEIQQKVYRATEELQQSLHREPTLKELAEAVNIREEGIVQALLAGTVPLEELDLSSIRNLRYESFRLPIEDQLLLKEALGKLSDIQRKVIYLIFYQGLTQVRTAELLGTNQRKISRLLKKSLEQLALYLVG
ncbi:MAG: sigma-70 family RNA polymerase sigma factor [Clostridia bacterium]|nr:sigma-70 family RNA polymerase sigma factor [Clostridia bacterium]